MRGTCARLELAQVRRPRDQPLRVPGRAQQQRARRLAHARLAGACGRAAPAFSLLSDQDKRPCLRALLGAPLVCWHCPAVMLIE
jgi:hypothetical protein